MKFVAYIKTHPLVDIFIFRRATKKSWKFSTSKSARLRTNVHKLKFLYVKDLLKGILTSYARTRVQWKLRLKTIKCLTY